MASSKISNFCYFCYWASLCSPDWNHLCWRKRKTKAKRRWRRRGLTWRQKEEDSPHCTENPFYAFPEMKLCGLIPNSYIRVSVSDLYIPRIGSKIGGPKYMNCLKTHKFGNWMREHFNSVLEISRPATFISGNIYHSCEKGNILDSAHVWKEQYSIRYLSSLYWKVWEDIQIMILKVMTSEETCIIKLFTWFDGRK